MAGSVGVAAGERSGVAAAADGEELGRLAARLDAHPDYRVLRRYQRPAFAPPPGGVALRTGLLVDLETTGLHRQTDAIIEIGLLAFHFGATGGIFGIAGEYCGLEDPGRPIPDEVQRLTRLSDRDVAGQRIDDRAVQTLLLQADLVIAHNARFDRAFAECRWPEFAAKWWACSASEIPWRELGVESSKLEYLAYRVGGVFADGHRALTDCEILLHVLSRPLADGRTALGALLCNSRRRSWRVRAHGAPFAAKDRLKARGYTWSAQERVWRRDVFDEDLPAERLWLRDTCDVRAPSARPFDGRLRWSPRLDEATRVFSPPLSR
ncbi:MAG: hypothetical protein HYV63_07685 [Candidatus Schekmanbacteria bacterium]|nr:hypothetical protein [Candidatus Schekmanbacteria bacterium]